MTTSFDSYIFDMDGTLWDAADSYCAVWNKTIADMAVHVQPVTRQRLDSLMGLPLDRIYDVLIGDKDIENRFMALLSDNEDAMMPVLGGKLYPGAEHTLRTLQSRGARLFMVSNCQKNGLPTFVEYCHLGNIFDDLLSLGGTGRPKEVNIRYLIERYNLQRPIYVGDTQGDCDSAAAAGIPSTWAAYGFGRDVTGYSYRIDHISDLLYL